MLSSGKWIVSMILAYIICQGLFPTPNIVGGGDQSMVILIVLTVIFKATIDLLVRRWKKKNDTLDKPPS
jgi:hypothetical protein